MRCGRARRRPSCRSRPRASAVLAAGGREVPVPRRMRRFHGSVRPVCFCRSRQPSRAWHVEPLAGGLVTTRPRLDVTCPLPPQPRRLPLRHAHLDGGGAERRPSRSIQHRGASADRREPSLSPRCGASLLELLSDIASRTPPGGRGPASSGLLREIREPPAPGLGRWAAPILSAASPAPWILGRRPGGRPGRGGGRLPLRSLYASRPRSRPRPADRRRPGAAAGRRRAISPAPRLSRVAPRRRRLLGSPVPPSPVVRGPPCGLRGLCRPVRPVRVGRSRRRPSRGSRSSASALLAPGCRAVPAPRRMRGLGRSARRLRRGRSRRSGGAWHVGSLAV
jgi:hypothetical protein